MSYLHTKFHENRISSFRGVAMTRFWDGRTDRQTGGRTDGRTGGRSDCIPRPAFAFGDAGKNYSFHFKKWRIQDTISDHWETCRKPRVSMWFFTDFLVINSKFPRVFTSENPENRNRVVSYFRETCGKRGVSMWFPLCLTQETWFLYGFPFVSLLKPEVAM